MKMLISFVLMLFSAMAFASTMYKLDPSHSEVGFQVKHLMVSNVSGKFKEFTGEFNFDEKTKTLENLVANIKVMSIDTRDPKRDEHLRGPDFFDAAGKPANAEMLFKQTKPAKMKDNKVVKVDGTLTIRGVTEAITLDVTYNGAVTDPWGNRKIGFEATGKVERKKYNVSWNKNLDGGGVVVGDIVNIKIDGEATAQAAEAKK